MCDLTNPIFNIEYAAFEYLESVRWPKGPICPHCGSVENITRLNGETTRMGLHQCNNCEGHFTVTVGTVYERSHIPLHKWLLATHLMCASKKGISSKQIERMLGITYKSAWFMTHRIRESMVPANAGPLGSGGGIVEADETYWGTSPRSKKAKAIKKAGGKVSGSDKQKVVSLVERNGNVRSFHVASVNGKTLKAVLHGNIAKEANLMTDDLRLYRSIGKNFASHEAVNHSSGEYARGEVSTNTVESFFALFKRGLIGTFHHVSPKHLGRYATEFDFRHNTRTALGYTDAERTEIAQKGIGGKRLTYRRIEGAQAAI